jgi:hypothetical protein
LLCGGQTGNSEQQYERMPKLERGDHGPIQEGSALRRSLYTNR